MDNLGLNNVIKSKTPRLTLFVFLVVLVIIYLLNFNLNTKVSVNNYILNTYGYIFLGLLLVVFTWVSIDEYNWIDISGVKLIAIMILSFITLFITILTGNNHYIIKHASWTLFMLSMGVMSYILYKKNIQDENLGSIIITLFSILLVFSYIAYNTPLDMTKNWGNTLMYILLTIIVIQIFDLIFGDYNNKSFITRNRIYGWIIIILFSGFLLYDTQKLIKEGYMYENLCKTIRQSQCVDYPRASLNLFLDIMNLFSGLTRIS